MPPSRDPLPPSVPISGARDIDSPNVFAQRGPSAVKKRLFPTPLTTQRTNTRAEDSPAKTPALLKGPVTHRYFHNKPLVTPRSTREFPRSGASALRYLPSVARLQATPGLKRKYVAYAPEMWRDMQAEDLTAWLNSILVDTGMDAAVGGERVAKSAVFQNQVKAMCDLYKEADVNIVLGKVNDEVLSGRFFVSRNISFATHFNLREQLIELLLLNYHPMWLLLALCAVLSCNFGVELDRSFDHLEEGASHVDKDRIFMTVLENIMQSKLMSADVAQVDTPASGGKKTDVKSIERDRFNATVLRRVLHLIFLLDRAKQSRTPVLSTDPPLFRIGSTISSSQEVIEQIGKDFLPDHGDVVRFLKFRGYWLTYVTPLFERASLVVKNLRKDLCDGIRLCKLASMLVKDRNILSKVRRDRNGMSRKDILSNHLGNVSLALSKVEEYANSHLDHPFEWKGGQQDIVNGELEKIITVLWQVSSLWLQINVLNKTALANELEIVQQEFREAKQQSRVSVWSPGGSASIPDLTHRVVSPSRLTVYENCETECGLLLLKWCATVAGMYGIAVRDFTESFRDGAPLCVILHHYCPELIRAGEFTRVQQAELRSVNDSEAESDIVQKNFDLFTSRVRLLGAIPHIPIRAEAALAPPFTSGGKDASFGRVMELLSSYLFKRLTLEREGHTDEIQADSFTPNERLSQGGSRNTSKSHLSSFETKQMSSVSASGTNHSRVGFRQTALDLNQPLRIKDGKAEESPSLLDGTESNLREANENLHDEKQPERDTENNSENRSSLCLNGINERNVEGKMSAGESSSSATIGEVEAAKLILQYYRAARSRRSYEQSKEAAVLIQTIFRGHKARKRADGSHGTEADSKGQIELDRCIHDEHDLRGPNIESELLLPSPARGASTENISLASIRTSRETLDQTITLLPMLHGHMNKIQAFAARMIFHEKNQAALSIQRCYRARSAAASAVATAFEHSGTDNFNNPWSQLKSRVFATIRDLSRHFFAEAEMQRKSYVTAIANAFYRAEQAYQIEMKASAYRLKEMNEAVRHQRSEHIRMREMFSMEEGRDNEALKMELQLLSDQVSSLETQLLDREDSVRAAESALRFNPAALNPSPSKMPLREATGLGGVNDLYDQDDLELFDLTTFQSETPKLRLEENLIIEEIEKTQAELTETLEAKGKELQQWRGLVLLTAHYIAEHSYIMCMEGLYEATSQCALKKLGTTSNLSLLDKEEKQMESAKASAFVQLDLNIIVAEKFYKQEEQWILEQTRCVSSKLSDACVLIESLYDVEEREEADNVWKVLDDSFKSEVDNCARDQKNFEAWRCAADLEDNALNDEIDRLEREEEQIIMAQRLHVALGLAEERYLSVMQSANAALQKDQAQRAERLEEHLSIAADEEILRQQFDENLTSLNRALNGLDSIMEERGKYVQSFATPTRSTVASSPTLNNLPLTALKSSPSVETRPLQDLSTNIVQALHFIDTQISAYSDMNETETLHEKASSLEDNPADRDLCNWKNHRVVDHRHISSLPQFQNMTKLSSAVESEEGTPSLYTTSENCYPTSLQRNGLRNVANVSDDGRTQLTVVGFIEQNPDVSQKQHWVCTIASENAEDKGFPTGSGSETTQSGMAAGTVEVEKLFEKAAEIEETDEIDRTQLDGARSEPDRSSLRKSGLFGNSPSSSSSTSTGRNLGDSLDYDDYNHDSSAVATNNQTDSPWHNESCQRAEGNHHSCSARSTPSNWTNETMQGSLLQLENSPQWTGNFGSSLTSKRSSLRNKSSQTVLTSVENRIDRSPSREDVAFWRTPKTSETKRGSACFSDQSKSLDPQLLSTMAKSIALESENTPLVSISERPTNDSSTFVGALQGEVHEPLKTPSGDSSYSGSFSALETPSYFRPMPRVELNFSPAAVVMADMNFSVQSHTDPDSYVSPLYALADCCSKEKAFEASTSLAPSHDTQERGSATKSRRDESPTVPAFSGMSAYVSLEKPNSVCMESKTPVVLNTQADEKGTTPCNAEAWSLRRLSQELSEIQVEMAKNDGSTNYFEVIPQAKPLESILRRISVASSKSANARSSSSNVIDAEEEFSVLNVIRAICVIIRQCGRSEGHLELVKLGMSIIRNMCRNEERVDSVLLVHDCVEVIVTCVQFYRDNEKIITNAVQALLALSLHNYGEALLATHANFLERLRGVQSILHLQNCREAKCNDRMRRASVILKAIENRRQNQVGRDFSTEMAEASSMIAASKPKIRGSAKLLETLLKRFPAW